MNVIDKPFNVDVNIRQSDYSGINKTDVKVFKIFPTLQGEGPFAGQFAVFVRLAGCNLGRKDSCPWCDTKFDFAGGKYMSPTEIMMEADDFCDMDRKRFMVLTGGEPLLQPAAPNFISFAMLHGWYVQIETNGYFWPDGMEDLPEEELSVICSPKVNQRGVYPMPQIPLKRIDALKILVDAFPNSPYHTPPKALVDAYSEAQHENHGGWLPIYLSPITHYRREPDPHKEALSILDPDTPIDVNRTRLNIEYAARLALKNGWRLSLQTHLFAALI